MSCSISSILTGGSYYRFPRMHNFSTRPVRYTVRFRNDDSGFRILLMEVKCMSKFPDPMDQETKNIV